MAGETIKTHALCLRIHPWSRTSHVVFWLSPAGRVATVVKGAVRPKSMFLGQYDLNYTCEIVYYASSRGSLHVLRECAPLDARSYLRSSFRLLAMADYFRFLAGELSPAGPECSEWFDMLEQSLKPEFLGAPGDLLGKMLFFEIRVLDLLGLRPALTAVDGAFALRGERMMKVSAPVAACIENPLAEKNRQTLLDAARVIGVFYKFHVDCASDIRRTVLKLISTNKQGSGTDGH